MTNKKIEKIYRLVGNINKEQLRYIDCFIGKDIAIFMPMAGTCPYALTPMHSHPSYMFVLPFSDQTSLKMVEGKIITARHGNIFSLSPDIPHHEILSDSHPRYIAIFIARKFFEWQLGLYPLKQKPVFCGELYSASSNFIHLLKRFMIEADNEMPGSKALLHALSLEICHSIIRGILNLAPLHDRISSRIEIDRAIEYMHSNLDKKMNVEEIARIAHMSSSHFYRIFKQEIGKSPIDYLHQIRLDRSKKFLFTGDKTITDIALECGFNSSAYFSSCFHKRFKVTPSEYRDNLKKGMISKKNNSILKY